MGITVLNCTVYICLVYFEISVISDIMGSFPTFLLLVLLTWTAQESLCMRTVTGGDSLEKATVLPPVTGGENTTGGDLSFMSGEDSNRPVRMMFKRDLNRARRRGKKVCRCIRWRGRFPIRKCMKRRCFTRNCFL